MSDNLLTGAGGDGEGSPSLLPPVDPGAGDRLRKMLAAIAMVGLDRAAVAMLAEFGGVEISLDDRRFLQGPLIVHESPWRETLPRWMIQQAMAERAEIVFGQRAGLVGPTELAAVMYPAMMDAPPHHETADLYCWATAHACSRHYGKPLAAIWKSLGCDPIPDSQVIERNGRLYQPYNSLALDIRRKVVAAAKARGIGKKPLPARREVVDGDASAAGAETPAPVVETAQFTFF